MNYLVFLDAQANELEKILSGTKNMVLKGFDTALAVAPVINPGDILYFLRNNGDCDLRVKATVSRVSFCINQPDGDIPHFLKEMQPRLQLTEDQYNEWSSKGQVLLVEFNSAQKIEVVHISPDKITVLSDWIPFEDFDQISQGSISS